MKKEWKTSVIFRVRFSVSVKKKSKWSKAKNRLKKEIIALNAQNKYVN